MRYGVRVTRGGSPVKGAQVIINTDGGGVTNARGIVRIEIDKDFPIAAPIVVRGEGFAMGMCGAVLEPNELLEIEI